MRDDLGSLSEYSNILAAGTAEMPAEWHEKLHRHDYYEVQLLVRGTSLYFNDFKRYEVSAGSLAFVSPGQLHTWLGDYSTFEVNVIAFRPKALSHTIQELIPRLPFDDTSINPVVTVPEAAYPLIEMLFNMAKLRFQAGAENWQQILASYLQSILVEAAQFRDVKAKTKLPAPSASSQLTKAFQLAVEQYYRERLQIHAYANRLGVTANHLIETVRESTGHTPKQIVQNRLLLEAKRLLVHTNRSAQQIGDELSFPNGSSFGRWFKHMTDKTPLHFRNQFEMSYTITKI
ncbi:MAG: helix-turn-helix transcriptional regulator [Chloroflexota bacterium]